MKDVMKQVLDEGALSPQEADARWRQLNERLSSRRRWRWGAALALAAAAAAVAVAWIPRSAPPRRRNADEGTVVWINTAAAPETEAVEIAVEAHPGGAMSAVPAAVALLTLAAAEPRFTLELKDVPAWKVFEQVGQMGRLEFRAPVDDGMKLTLKLRNAPASTVYAALADRLGLRYRQEGDIAVLEPRDAPLPASVCASPSAAAAAAAPGAPAAASPDVMALKARIAELEQQILSMRQERVAEDGTPVPMPPGLPLRLSDPVQLQTLFNAAMREAGFDKADVTSVDCTEYPCIVYGKGFGKRGDFEKLQELKSFAAYKDDKPMSYGWAHDKDRNPERYTFAVAMIWDGATQKLGDLRKRLDYRVNQMHADRDVP